MKNDYVIGYISKTYARDLCRLYTVVFILNLIIAFFRAKSLSPFELFFTSDPFIYVAFYFGTVIAWNYAKEEETRGNNDRRRVIYFKSVGFLYLTMVIINFLTALYAGTTLGFDLLIVNNDLKFYSLIIIYGMFELYYG